MIELSLIHLNLKTPRLIYFTVVKPNMPSELDMLDAIDAYVYA